MMWNNNIYYSPEKFGLTVVADEDIAGSYEFDKMVVFCHNDGKLFYGQDSGCSCPVPFEDFNGIEDLIPINKQLYEMFSQEAMRYLDATVIANIRQEVHR